MRELDTSYRNHTYHVCLIFISLPGHKMTSLQTCTANMSPLVEGCIQFLFRKKQKIIYQQSQQYEI